MKTFIIISILAMSSSRLCAEIPDCFDTLKRDLSVILKVERMHTGDAYNKKFYGWTREIYDAMILDAFHRSGKGCVEFRDKYTAYTLSQSCENNLEVTVTLFAEVEEGRIVHVSLGGGGAVESVKGEDET